ncbi:TetR family transcriptional regulator [Gordonia sp. JH63]|uniref:TetR/AcrR family transcriptional regulator n=1 Tax=Gordonia sp. JH63 TaxID=2698900 RepID=UPI0019398904|nr:TetR family transcriptional regulator [Gordonia sp. JH63]
MSADQRRAALIDAAYRVVADFGVEGATTRRICAYAGMKLGSFHYAFESRIALLSAVMETAVPADITAVLDSIVPDDVDPASGDALDMESQLRRHFRGFYGLLQAEPGRMQAVIALGIYARNHPELHTAGAHMYARLFTIAAAGLERGARHAGVQWTVPVAELGPVVIAATNAITLTYLSLADDAAIDQIIDASVRGLMSYVQ